MQPDSRGEDRPAETREGTKDRERRFRIIKLEERIAPGNGHGNGSDYGCGNPKTGHHNGNGCY